MIMAGMYTALSCRPNIGLAEVGCTPMRKSVAVNSAVEAKSIMRIAR